MGQGHRRIAEDRKPFWIGERGMGSGKWSDGSLFTRSKRRNSLRTSKASPGLRRWCVTLGTSPTCSARTCDVSCFNSGHLSLHASPLGAHAYPVDPTRRNVVEFRHRSWWDGRATAECPHPRDSLLRAPRDLRLRAASRQPHGPGETAGFFATLIRLPQNITGTGRGDSPNIRFAVCKGR
jgi:hypothetical protein